MWEFFLAIFDDRFAFTVRFLARETVAGESRSSRPELFLDFFCVARNSAIAWLPASTMPSSMSA